jgi:membrane protease YdiL (CAAX protease family)
VWNGWDIVLLLAAALFALFFVGGIVFGVAAHIYGGTVTPTELSRDPKVLVPAQALSYVALLIFMGVLLRLRYHARFLHAVQWRWPAGADWLKYVAGGILLAGLIQALSYLFPMPPSLPIDKYFRDATSAWLLAGFGILVAPPVEELFYRGFLYPVLARPLGVFWGVVLTSIPFALMHASQLASAWAPLFMLFLVSVALTLTRAKTGSVAASVLVHMAYNTTLFTMLFFATDHFQHLEKAL